MPDGVGQDVPRPSEIASCGEQVEPKQGFDDGMPVAPEGGGHRGLDEGDVERCEGPEVE